MSQKPGRPHPPAASADEPVVPGQAVGEPDLSIGGDLVTVRLLQVPLPLLTAAQQASDELMREFTLIASQLRRDPVDSSGNGPEDRNRPADTSHPSGEGRLLPARLVSIVETLNAGYGPFTGEQDAVIDQAVASGEPVLPELTYKVPSSAAAAAVTLSHLLDEADEYCQAGQHLLTLATPPELVAFRRWFLEEFPRQTRGLEPVPWRAYAAEHTPDS